MDNKDFAQPTTMGDKDILSRREFLEVAGATSLGAVSMFLFGERAIAAGTTPEAKTYEVLRRFGAVDLTQPYSTVATDIDTNKKTTYDMTPININTDTIRRPQSREFDEASRKSMIFGSDGKAIFEYAHTWRDEFRNDLPHEKFRKLLEAQVKGDNISGYEIPYLQNGQESVAQVAFATKIDTGKFWAARQDTDGPFRLRLGANGLGLPQEIVQLCNQEDVLILAGCADKGRRRGEFVKQMVMVTTLKK